MLLPSLLNFSMAGAKASCGRCAVLEKTNLMWYHLILPRSKRKAAAAMKYHPLESIGSIFMTMPLALGVSAEIQFQSPSSISVRSLMESRQQKIDQSEELYFPQLARHRTTSTLHVCPRPEEPC